MLNVRKSLLAAVCQQLESRFLLAAPANDLLANATLLPADATAISGTTVDATRDRGEWLKQVGRAVWYKWTPAQTGVYELDYGMADPMADPTLNVHTFTGKNVQSMQAFENSYYASGGRDGFSLIAGQTYWISVDSGTNAAQAFSIGLTRRARPANDDFTSATVVTTGVAVPGSVYGATPELKESPLGAMGKQTVWYKWTAPATGVYKVQASSTVPDSSSGVETAAYLGSSLKSLKKVSGDLYSYNSSGGGDTVWVDAAKGKTYSIAVAGNWSPNDFSMQITPQSLAPVAISGVRARQDPFGIGVEWDQCDGAVQYDVYRSTTASFAKAKRVGTASTNVYLDASVRAGALYHYWVQGRSALGTSAMSFPVAGRAPLKASGNDMLSKAYVLSGTSPAAWYDNRKATTQPGELPVSMENDEYGDRQTLGRTVWFKWIAPVSGNAYADARYSYPAVRLYTSGVTQPALSDLQPLSSDYGSFNATAGTTYWIQVDADVQMADGPRDMFGVYIGDSSSIEGAIVGQTFASAPSSTETSVKLQVSGMQALALGEPSLGGRITTSTWWSWTAVQSGYARIAYATEYGVIFYEGTTAQYISVYGGSSVNALAPVVSGVLPSGDSTPMVGFYAMAGTTYRIQAGAGDHDPYSGYDNWILEQQTGKGSNVAVISGTDNADAISLSGDAVGQICYAAIGDMKAVYSLAGVAGVQVQGRRGDDVITLSGNLPAMRLLGQDGNDTITGGAGADVLDGGTGNDWLYAIGDGQRDSLIGGAGIDHYSADATDILKTVEIKI